MDYDEEIKRTQDNIVKEKRRLEFLFFAKEYFNINSKFDIILMVRNSFYTYSI